MRASRQGALNPSGERMRIVSRYVLRQASGALLMVLLSLTGITWIGVALRQLELMTNQGQDVWRFLAMTTLALPSMLAVIAPIALLIACIYVLTRLSADSELIVMTSGGMPAWALLKPLGLLALLVAVLVASVNHVVGPGSQRLLREMAAQVRTDLMAQVIQPWRFTSPEPKLMVHIRDRGPSGELLGLMMHDARDPKQVVTYLAERGLIIKQAGMAYLRMDKGHIVRRLEHEQTPQIIVFDRYAVDLNQLEQRVDQANQLRPRERSTVELMWPDPDDPLYRQAPGRISAELHDRLSSPLYALAFVMLVVASLGHARTTRQNRNQAAVLAFVLAVGCRLGGIVATNAAAVRTSAIPLMYAVPLAAAVLAALATQWHAYPHRPSRWGAALRWPWHRPAGQRTGWQGPGGVEAASRARS
jgi:lipopolysaccharide export system permease protein